jgi:hypothetical protein
MKELSEKELTGVELSEEDIQSDEHDGRRENNVQLNIRKSLKKLNSEDLLERCMDLYKSQGELHLEIARFKRKCNLLESEPRKMMRKVCGDTMKLLKKRIHEWKAEDLPYSNDLFFMQKLNLMMDKARAGDDFIKMVRLMMEIQKHKQNMELTERVINSYIAETRAKTEKVKQETKIKKKTEMPAEEEDDLPAAPEVSPELQKDLDQISDEDMVVI